MAIFASHGGQLDSCCGSGNVSVVENIANRDELMASNGDLVYVTDDSTGTGGMYVWIGAGWVEITGAQQSGEFRLDANVDGGEAEALDLGGNRLLRHAIDFYEIRMHAIDSMGNESVRHVKGVISGMDILRIDEILQEDFFANITMSTDGHELTILCSDPGMPVDFTIYVSLIKIKD